MSLKSIIAAAALATGLAGAAQAAPMLNGDVGNDTVKTDSAVTPVYYGCVPTYRWVYTYYGWKQVYAGQRCPNYGPYGYNGYNGYNNRPHGGLSIRTPDFRLRIGF
jgi:hypothetical protein